MRRDAKKSEFDSTDMIEGIYYEEPPAGPGEFLVRNAAILIVLLGAFGGVGCCLCAALLLVAGIISGVVWL
ncbi:MAG: hypothetical protein JXB47_08320 [Anaerolineae bacterium]|nr:hypothetical protein [Anaerolineae bacterium]